MESAAATVVGQEPWRASADPSRSSSLCLDQVYNRRNSYEVSGRFIASNEIGSPFATPLSSVQHLDDVIDDLSEEVLAAAQQGSLERPQALVRASPCGSDIISFSHSLRMSASITHAAGTPAHAGKPCARPPGSAQIDVSHLQTDDSGPTYRPIDSLALHAFVCDDRGGNPQPSQLPQSQPEARRLQQPHPTALYAPHRRVDRCNDPPPPPPPQQQHICPHPELLPIWPSAAATSPCHLEDVAPGLHVRAPAWTLSATARVAAAGAAGTSAAGLTPPGTPHCTGGGTGAAATDSPTVGGGRFGRPLSGIMLSSLRKVASDAVSQLRALGSGRSSRNGNGNGTGVTTPTAVASLRQSVDSTAPHTVLGGAVASASAGTVERGQTPASAGWCAAAESGARRPNPGSGTPAAPSLLQGEASSAYATGAAATGSPHPTDSPHPTGSWHPTGLDSSLDESLALPCSSWVVGARSSSTLLANGQRDSAGSCSVLNGSRGQPSLLDERQGSDALPDMWDLARILDEVDDGFPPMASTPGTVAAPSASYSNALRVCDRGPATEVPHAHNAPVRLLCIPASTSAADSGERLAGTGTPAPSLPLPRSYGGPQSRIATLPLSGAGFGWPSVLSAAGGSVGGLRGHDAEQLYVLSELVQQARASEGAEAVVAGRSRVGAVLAAQLQGSTQAVGRQGPAEATLQGEPLGCLTTATVCYCSPPAAPEADPHAASKAPARCALLGSPAVPEPMRSGALTSGSAGRGSRSRSRAASGVASVLPFSGNAAAGGLTVADPLYTSAPSRLAFAPPAPGGCGARDIQPEGLWTALRSVPPASEPPEESNRATAAAVAAAAWVTAAAAAPSARATTRGAGAANNSVCRQALPSMGMYGMSSGALGSTSSLAALETGPELSMFWPLVMPTPVPPVLAGNAEAAKRAACPFMLNVLVSCSCGCGSALGCSAAANNSSNNGSTSSTNYVCRAPRAGLVANGNAAVQLSSLPPPPQLPNISLNAMLSGVQLANVVLSKEGGQAAMLRLPLLPSLQLVNVFASSGADIGPACTLLAVPPAMAEELQGMFADKVEASMAAIMDHVNGDALGCDGRRRGGCGGGAGAARTAGLQAQIRRDLAALRRPSPTTPPWAMSVPVWAACRREWRSAMQPLLHDICYLLLCVPNCFSHGLVEWDQNMYCETLARLLAQLERHKLWQTISTLLEYCSRQGVALLYQGEALGAGSLSADRLRLLLEGALHDEISIKAICGSGEHGGLQKPFTGPDGEVYYAVRASAVGGSGSGGPTVAAKGRRASVAALMAPDGADAATAATLQAWRRRSLGSPANPRDAAAACDVYDTAEAYAATLPGTAVGVAAASRSRGRAVSADADADAAVLGSGLRSLPESGRALRSQASIGRVLGRVLSVLARGGDGAGGSAAAGGVADGSPGLAPRRDLSRLADTATPTAGSVGGRTVAGAATTAAAAPAGQRLGHVIENTAVVLAFAGVMLQSLL